MSVATMAPPMHGMSSLSREFEWVSKGADFILKGAVFALKAGLLWAGFFGIECFLDYGLIHSEGFIGSALANMSTEFLSPITEKIPALLSSDPGQIFLGMLQSTLRAIHRFFDITDTFLDPVIDLSQSMGGYAGQEQLVPDGLF